jgi:hypothetical protein
MRGVIAAILFLATLSGVSAFVMIDGFYSSEYAFPDSFVEASASIDLEDHGIDDNLKVVFTIPELGVRASKGPFDPEDLRDVYVYRSLDIPWDAEPGEYVVRMTVTDDDGNKRIKHRFIEIE